MTDTALAPKQETGLMRIKNYMLSPEVKERFSEMMGPSSIYYLNQVMIVVANSPELQKCSPQSILTSAMRAASLRLSVDPGQGQAWIIPYKGEAAFQLGYKGVYELAQRTNLYRYINVITIFEGEELVENRMTGIQTIGGKRTGNNVIGYMLYFKLVNGFEKTFYMSLEEIDAHARHYSQGYNNPRSKWHDPVERPKMEKKTVLVNGLRKWGRFNPADADMLDQIESEQGWNGATDLPDEDAVTVIPVEVKSEEQLLAELTGEKPAPVPEPEKQPEEQKQPEPEAPKPLNYAGATAVIGHHKYPVAWCKTLAGYKKVNEWELDGILQKLALPGGTAPEDVVAEIDLYLEDKAHKQPELL